MKCILGSTYTMKADILSRYDAAVDDNDATTGDKLASVDGQTGHYEVKQDPDSGAIERIWKPYIAPVVPEGESIPEPTRKWTFDCIARGVVDGGIRVAGTTERWSTRGTIDTVDYVSLKFPPNVLLTRRDRVTNIRDSRSGKLLWVEEEMGAKPTVFEVNGVTPVIDPFGKHVQNFALLARAEIQDG